MPVFASAGSRRAPGLLASADGLGPESDRDDGSPSAFAPSPIFFTRSRVGFPALACRKASQLRLHMGQVCIGRREGQWKGPQRPGRRINWMKSRAGVAPTGIWGHPDQSSSNRDLVRGFDNGAVEFVETPFGAADSLRK